MCIVDSAVLSQFFSHFLRQTQSQKKSPSLILRACIKVQSR